MTMISNHKPMTLPRPAANAKPATNAAPAPKPAPAPEKPKAEPKAEAQGVIETTVRVLQAAAGAVGMGGLGGFGGYMAWLFSAGRVSLNWAGGLMLAGAVAGAALGWLSSKEAARTWEDYLKT